MFRKLWKDDGGVIALEYLFLSTVVGLGMAVGFSAVSDALNAEYSELASAIVALDQGYEINTQQIDTDNASGNGNSNGQANENAVGWKAGTSVRDTPGSFDYERVSNVDGGKNDSPGLPAQTITLAGNP